MKKSVLLILLCAGVGMAVGARHPSRPSRAWAREAQSRDAVPAPPSAQAPAVSALRVEPEIRALLNAQVDAWNRGDIEDFMKGYWNSPNLAFLSSGGISRGWQMLLNRYTLNYPDRAAMGTLAFEDLEITVLAPDAAMVLGRWQLERERSGKKDTPGGVFLLVIRKFPAGWRIVADHTSTVVQN